MASAGAGAGAAGDAGEDAAGASHVPLVRKVVQIYSVPCLHTRARALDLSSLHSPPYKQSRFKAIAQQEREMGALGNDTLERICT